jgi:acyl-CoA thioesterase
VSEQPKVDFEMLCESVNQIPMYQLIGMRAIEARAGYSRFRLPFRKELTQPMGVMHGGALATVADSAVAVALWGMVGMDKVFTTIELKINYIGAVSSGEVIAEGNILHCGRTTAVGEVEVRDHDGRLVAKCLATYMILPAVDGGPEGPNWGNSG